VTWPTNVIVKHVSFVYLGGPEHPVYLPPAAFLPDSSVTPLPAASVASGPAGSKIAANTILSGEFLIPPTSASFGPPPSSIGTAWRSSPWAWPYGAYQVTVTTTTGTRKSVLDLLLTGLTATSRGSSEPGLPGAMPASNAPTSASGAPTRPLPVATIASRTPA